MRAKAARVKDIVRQRAQRRDVGRRVESRLEKGYRIVAISLYSDQAASVDRATQDLVDGGYRGASRSFVIQAAIERLQQDLIGKSREEVLRYFAEQHPRRPLAVMPPRAQQLRLFNL